MPRKHRGHYLRLNRAGAWEICLYRDGQVSARSTGTADKKEAEVRMSKWLLDAERVGVDLAGLPRRTDIEGFPARKLPKEAPRGHRLYVIGWQEAGPVKIGYATDMRVRRSAIQTTFPFPLVVYHEADPVRYARAAEAIARLLLRDKALLGEWFDVDAARAREVVGQALERAAAEAGQWQGGATTVRRSIVKAARRRVRGRSFGAGSSS